MSSTVQFRFTRPRATGRMSALDRLTQAYARSHYTHETPLVGCYQCLHDVARRPIELASAA